MLVKCYDRTSKLSAYIIKISLAEATVLAVKYAVHTSMWISILREAQTTMPIKGINFIDFLLSVLKVVIRPFNTKSKKAGFVASKN